MFTNRTSGNAYFKVFDKVPGEHDAGWGYQAVAMSRALDFFKAQTGMADIATKYSQVMIVRHDMLWEQPIDQWPTVDFGKFNFFSRCEGRQNGPLSWGGPPESCVNDLFFLMPASHLLAFDSILGKPFCFKGDVVGGSGHGCYNYLACAIGHGQITFVTDWRPMNHVR